ncbi:hypothetical protein ACPA9J_26650 [Pseudomonas aeruginosa]
MARISDRYQQMMRDLNPALKEASIRDPLDRPAQPTHAAGAPQGGERTLPVATARAMRCQCSM